MNTPRTNAVAHHCTACTSRQEVVPADFARQLETELNACREALATQHELRALSYRAMGWQDKYDYHWSLGRHLRDLETPLDTTRL